MMLSLEQENAILRKLLVQTTKAYEEKLNALTEKEQELGWQATHDSLTRLINRHEFDRRINQLLEYAKSDFTEHALLYIDLDQFKIINDTCGHIAGDELLMQLSAELQRHIRDSDTLARLGGDEFGVLLECCSEEQANLQANRLRKAIREYRFHWHDKTFELGVSIGVVMISDLSGNATELLSEADIACYMAKEGGRNRVHVYQLNDVDIVRRRGEMHWVSRIVKALEQDRFVLYKQKMFALADSQVSHYEILVRMIDEENNIIPPSVFIPAAERFNLMPAIDRWVVDRAFDYLSRPSLSVDSSHRVHLSINLSGVSISEESFLEYIQQRLAYYEIAPEDICFEITETAAIHRFTQASKLIQALKKLGCQFALDDFGSGLSSFGYLKHIPVDYLKIDGGFVQDIVEDPIDFAMVSAIHKVGKAMGIKTVAEFVENIAVIDRLREIGIDYIQGFGVEYPHPFIEENPGIVAKEREINIQGEA